MHTCIEHIIAVNTMHWTCRCRKYRYYWTFHCRKYIIERVNAVNTCIEHAFRYTNTHIIHHCITCLSISVWTTLVPVGSSNNMRLFSTNRIELTTLVYSLKSCCCELYYKPGFLLLYAVIKALSPFLLFKTRVYCLKHGPHAPPCLWYTYCMQVRWPFGHSFWQTSQRRYEV